MAKKMASKTTKELLSDVGVKERKLNKSDFSTTWQGRLQILQPAKSQIAEKAGFKQAGEYAIKVR